MHCLASQVKGNAGGGGGKSKKKGGAEKVVKSRALKTSSDALVKLRAALRLPDGKVRKSSVSAEAPLQASVPVVRSTPCEQRT